MPCFDLCLHLRPMLQCSVTTIVGDGLHAPGQVLIPRQKLQGLWLHGFLTQRNNKTTLARKEPPRSPWAVNWETLENAGIKVPKASCYISKQNLLPYFLPYLLPSFLPYLLTYILPYFLTSLLPCYLASLLPCFLASLLPCFLASLLPCFLASLLTCLLAYLLTCLLTYLLTYLLTSLLTYFLTYLLIYLLTYTKKSNYWINR